MIVNKNPNNKTDDFDFLDSLKKDAAAILRAGLCAQYSML